jgi:hypothetical protein
MLKQLAVVSLLAGIAASSTSPAPAQQPPAASAPAPDSALTGRFSSFFTQILGRHIPSGNLSPQLKSGLTPTLLAQIDNAFGQYGTFRRLQFVSQDSMQGYQRYHYSAVFDKGSQGVMFVVDSNGTIVGFFQDRANNGGQ